MAEASTVADAGVVASVGVVAAASGGAATPVVYQEVWVRASSMAVGANGASRATVHAAGGGDVTVVTVVEAIAATVAIVMTVANVVNVVREDMGNIGAAVGGARGANGEDVAMGIIEAANTAAVVKDVRGEGDGGGGKVFSKSEGYLLTG